MAQFRRVLVANRGEIAVRIIRACRQLGLETLAVFSSADRHSLHVQLADSALCIGPPAAKDSYLNIPALLTAAHLGGADAVHPGYGFLAESPAFAEAVCRSGLTFIGPDAAVMARLGDKLSARQTMAGLGLPLIPGSDGALTSMEQAKHLAQKLGYPLIIKASAGGGGRGMKVVSESAELEQALALTRAEAKASFGNDSLYLERYLTTPRHIEFQLLCDGKAALCLGSRDCSAQRRHQKLIEEAPAPGLDAAESARISALCEQACVELGYCGVATFEFLYQDGRFFFIEVNTRIQVEHTVTEMVTGIDLLAWQLKLARGEPQPPRSVLKPSGHAIECRINAEDPERQLPGTGTVTGLHLPGGPGIRWDSHLYPGYEIPSQYDSLVGKLIAWGEDRDQALCRVQQALAELDIKGIHNNIALQRRLLASPELAQQMPDIHFVERLLETQ
ncbi:acetyl-CoA carboxylase biotin carboxylase subunit [Shewanella sedimentimangrovi]|uniref:biotin carboxylase n=1 Tax=Shewanella sedimentimangrovi TaxID=2814293 RepID=A0ABX7R124_9GAMM|nr:acetyl-CoA carboxylase biotin carboxylase subunit [Shewanella sedimentimangrovi]QSX36881.1 acetyl-CoA carboxylase biotin carboxylase subunit [Shewanella sedimentimangrovi]